MKKGKVITIKDIPVDLFFRAVKLKAELHCKTWGEFLKKVVKKLEG